MDTFTSTSTTFDVNTLINPGKLKWTTKNSDGQTEVTYSFTDRVPDYSDSWEHNNFVAFNATQIGGARRALGLWKEVANITFKEVPNTRVEEPANNDGGQIRFGTANTGDVEGAHGRYPSDNGGGDVWLNNSETGSLYQAPGSYGFQTMLHEIGHALGLRGCLKSSGKSNFMPGA